MLGSKAAIAAGWGAGLGGIAVLLGLLIYIDGFNGAEANDIANGLATTDLLGGGALFFYGGLSVALFLLGLLAADGYEDEFGSALKRAGFAVFLSYIFWLPADPATVTRWMVFIPAGVALGLWIVIHVVARVLARWEERRRPGSFWLRRFEHAGPAWPIVLLTAGVSCASAVLVTLQTDGPLLLGSVVGAVAGLLSGIAWVWWRARRTGQAPPTAPTSLPGWTAPFNAPPPYGQSAHHPVAPPTAGPSQPTGGTIADGGRRPTPRRSDRRAEQQIAIVGIAVTIAIGVAQIVVAFITAR